MSLSRFKGSGIFGVPRSAQLLEAFTLEKAKYWIGRTVITKAAFASGHYTLAAAQPGTVIGVPGHAPSGDPVLCLAVQFWPEAQDALPAVCFFDKRVFAEYLCLSHTVESPAPSSIRLCRKVRFLGQNPKIGYRKFNVLQTAKLSKKQLCDRARDRACRAGHHGCLRRPGPQSRPPAAGPTRSRPRGGARPSPRRSGTP